MRSQLALALVLVPVLGLGGLWLSWSPHGAAVSVEGSTDVVVPQHPAANLVLPVLLQSMTHVNHPGRVTLTLPIGWQERAGDGGFPRYVRAGEVITTTAIAQPANLTSIDPVAALRTLCQELAGAAQPTPLTREGQPGCIVPAPSLGSGERLVLVRYPSPPTSTLGVNCTTRNDQAFVSCTYVVVKAPASALSEVATTLSFRVSRTLYLDRVLAMIRAKAVLGDVANLRSTTEGFANEARTLADQTTTTQATHPLIRRFLRQLGDRHSSLSPPEIVQEQEMHDDAGLRWVNTALEGQLQRVIYQVGRGSAAEGQVEEGEIVEAVTGFEPVAGFGPSEMTPLYGSGQVVVRRHDGTTASINLTAQLYRNNLDPGGRRLPGDVGYIELFGNRFLDWDDRANGATDNYAQLVHLRLKVIDGSGQARVCRWVVDLRRDDGGRLDQMLQAIGPLLLPPTGGGDTVSLFRTFHPGLPESMPSWQYRRDGALIVPGRPLNASALITEAHQLAARPAVAVLTSRITASAGEMAAIAFQGRSQVRTFGEATRGLTTMVSNFPLFDGAMLNLGTAWLADERDVVHRAALQPDEPVGIDWRYLQTHRPLLQSAGQLTATELTTITQHDAVLGRALEWLNSQPACP